ncbi:MAG TPA: hypothetical protein VFN67_27035 [Polyangiales bacterium]|nr:hypothetical protein [Polyangiales bacterium]
MDSRPRSAHDFAGAAPSGDAKPTRLSKSRYMAGLQCEKRLWWAVHQPDAAELTPDRAQEALFDRGHEVGALAREHRPGGVLIDFPHEQIDARVDATRRALARGETVIYEASFLQNGIFVALSERIEDLLPIVRDHVYHPDFGGSFSLKAVAPVLAPQLSYRELSIASGEQASFELERLLLDPD